MDNVAGPLLSFYLTFYKWIDSSTSFVRGMVTPHQKHYPWYHQKFRRVPTVDECYATDMVCMKEANSQLQRDKMVDDAIIVILRDRAQDCVVYHGVDSKEMCKKITAEWKEAAANWFCKYGDLGPSTNAKATLMKQKHRMIWERRHGKVGSGVKYED